MLDMNIIDQLNPEQKKAVVLPSCSALILAGAGSGKTRVLTTRLAFLLGEGLANPFEIMAVTFTNKAAREMTERVTAIAPVSLKGLWIGTFHGLSHRFLRQHHAEAGLPKTFQIADTGDQLAILRDILKDQKLAAEYTPQRALSFISRAKDKGFRAKDVSPRPREEAFLSVYFAYERKAQEEGLVDFGELLLKTVEVLRANEALRQSYQRRFRHILVDEFQDTSFIQYEWLRLFAGSDTALFVVGDDDQSIYAFRGAEPGNMQAFLQDFGIKEIIRLEQNYRSHAAILQAANSLIAYNPGRIGKNLWTNSTTGEKITVFEAESDHVETSFIARSITAAINHGTKPEHIAVLYRANALSRPIEHALFTASIPYRVYGGLRFFEREEIKHGLAYLRLAANPKDALSFIRAAQNPPKGIGSKTLAQLASDIPDQSLFEAAKDSGKAPLLRFVSLIEALVAAAQKEPLPKMVEKMLALSNLVSFYEDKNEKDRVENLRELVNAAASFVVENPESGLDDFLAYAALEGGTDRGAGVNLMTVHSSKGLEFDLVFVMGLEEGLFPHENALMEKNGVEEERRLMYVAITRAKKKLFLTHATERLWHGSPRRAIPSRFFKEIDPETYETVAKNQAVRVPKTSLMSAPTKAQKDQHLPFAVGQKVWHAKFGDGIVLRYDGKDMQLKIEVRFAQAGTKWLSLAHAKLTT